MITQPQCFKHYNSAKKRFLQSLIERFLQREFPRTFGPIILEKISQKIVEIVEKQLPRKDYLKPGQCIWNVVSIKTRPDHPNCEFVPVILTLVDPSDIKELVEGTPMSKIAGKAIARITCEAYKQGGLLSMRDIGLLGWSRISRISDIRKQWESEHNVTLPHTGSIQDFGSCISHKVTIVQKVVYEKKDPTKVANETKHSQKAVDRYLKDFYRVKTCYEYNNNIDFICQTTGLSKYLVQQYLKIILENEKKNDKRT
jgi:hypothetical protein